MAEKPSKDPKPKTPTARTNKPKGAEKDQGIKNPSKDAPKGPPQSNDKP